MRRSWPLLTIVLLAAACGGSAPEKPYQPAPTANCLRDHGYKVSLGRGVDVVIATAEYGGLRALKPGGGNELQIAFTAGPQDAQFERQAIRRTAPPRLRPRIDDIVRIRRNAVLRWTIAPSSDDEETAIDCLAS